MKIQQELLLFQPGDQLFNNSESRTKMKSLFLNPLADPGAGYPTIAPR
jgi:hypothetical protein